MLAIHRKYDIISYKQKRTVQPCPFLPPAADRKRRIPDGWTVTTKYIGERRE
jgi:hypothetical protein